MMDVTLFAVSLSRDEILALATRAAAVADVASPRPILASTMLDASGDTLTATATDLGVTYVGRRVAEVRAPGSVCVSAKWLRDIVAVLPDGTVDIVATASRGRIPTALHLSTQGHRRRFQILVAPGEDFPAVEHATGTSIKLNGGEIIALLDTVHHAADPLRFPAVYAHLEGRTVRAECAASTRISWAASDVARDAASVAAKFQIPQRLLSALPKIETEVTLTIDLRRITLDVGSDRWSCATSQDDFPPLDQIRAQLTKASAVIRVNRGDMLDALRLVSLAAGDRVDLECVPAERTIRLSASSLGVVVGEKKTGRKQENGDDEITRVFSNDASTADIDATFEGATPPERFGLNVAHARQSLVAMNCELVDLRMSGTGAPAFICNPNDDRACEVLALMREV